MNIKYHISSFTFGPEPCCLQLHVEVLHLLAMLLKPPIDLLFIGVNKVSEARHLLEGKPDACKLINISDLIYYIALDLAKDLGHRLVQRGLEPLFELFLQDIFLEAKEHFLQLLLLLLLVVVFLGVLLLVFELF